MMIRSFEGKDNENRSGRVHSVTIGPHRMRGERYQDMLLEIRRLLALSVSQELTIGPSESMAYI